MFLLILAYPGSPGPKVANGCVCACVRKVILAASRSRSQSVINTTRRSFSSSWGLRATRLLPYVRLVDSIDNDIYAFIRQCMLQCTHGSYL